MKLPIIMPRTSIYRAYYRRSTQVRRLLLMLGVALILVVGLGVLLGSTVAADSELVTWHDFAPQGWVNTYNITSTVDLTTAIAPLQATAKYSVSLTAGMVWFGPYDATLTNLSSNEWRLKTGPIPILTGQDNRVRYAIQLTGGQRIKSDAYTIKMDPIAPELDIAMPAAGAYISVANVAIGGTAIDPLSGVESITATVGGQALTPTLTLPNWSASWPAPVVDGMQYTIAAAAGDKAGNWATETVTITVDRVPPTNPTSVVETHGITNGASLPAPTPLHFQWTGASDGGGIAGYRVYWGRNATGTTYTFTTAAEYTPPALTQIGRYYLRIATQDLAGNLSQWATFFSVTLESVTRKNYLPLIQNRPYWAIYEPNNSRATAYGPLTSGTTYQAYIWPVGDQDYYFIDVTATSTDVTIGLTNMPANTDFDLYLYDSGTAPLPVASSANFGNVDEFIRYRPTMTGRYYIRVYPYQGASKQQPYRLKATFR